MSELHYDDPEFEIVDGPSDVFPAVDLTNVAPVNLDETDEAPTGDPIHKEGNCCNENDDEDAEVLREN